MLPKKCWNILYIPLYSRVPPLLSYAYVILRACAARGTWYTWYKLVRGLQRCCTVRGCPRLMRQLDTYWDGEHSCKSPDRTIEKNEIPPHWPFRNWLILNGQWDGIFIFFFFGPVDLQECSRGWGDGGARDCERGPKNRPGVAADCPGFEYICKLIYCIFCRLMPILR